MRYSIIKRMKPSNKRGMLISKTNHSKTPYFYHSEDGFIMERYSTLKQALARWNFDNSKKADGQWASILPTLSARR